MLGTALKPVNNVLGGIRLQTSVWGIPIPIVRGRARVSVNVLDCFNWVSKAANSKKGASSSGKKGDAEYDYGGALILALCRGRGNVASLGSIWQTQGQLASNTAVETYMVPSGGGTYTAEQLSTYMQDLGVSRADNFSFTADDYGSPGPVTLTGVQQTPMAEVDGSPGAGQYDESGGYYTFSGDDAGKLMTVSYLFAPPITEEGTDEDPITSIGFTLLPGVTGEAVWDVVAALGSPHAIGYSDLAKIVSPRVDLGMAGVAPNYSVEVICNIAPGHGNGQGDELPYDTLDYMFTDALEGVGIQSGELGDRTAYDNYCGANGLYVSATYNDQNTLSDLVSELLEATNSELVESDFLLKVIPRGDTTIIANGFTFQPNTAPVYELTEDDLIRSGSSPALKISIKDAEECTNTINAQFQDRNNQYNNVPVTAQDQNSVQLYGPRVESRDWGRIFKSSTAAIAAVQSLLQRMVYLTRTFKFTATQRFALLEPMDVITVPEPKNGATVNTPVRITSIEEQENGNLDIEAEDFPWGVSGTTIYPKQPGASNMNNANLIPGPVNAPIIFEALSRLNNQIGHALWFGVSGQQNWGGYRVSVSVDGGSTYQSIGVWMARANMGVLTADFPSAADPDTTDTLAVDLTESSGELSSNTAAQTDADVPLCFVDDNGSPPFELVSYETATLTAACKYSLGTRIRRGVFNSPIGDHPSGSRFLFLDSNVFGWLYDPSLISKELFFKFTSLNQVGLEEQDISTVTAYPFTPTGASLGLLTPAHATYAPTSNPLTAIDAGTSATVDIAAFEMGVPGVRDIPEDSGQILSLPYNTLEYIFFDDPGFLGGAVTYQADTNKAVALKGAGRFFVGSIRTPISGGPSTSGNGDGGAGAQTGVVSLLGFSGVTTSVTGSGSVVNASQAIDGNPVDYALLAAPAGANTASLIVSVPASALQQAASIGLRYYFSLSGPGALSHPVIFTVSITTALGTTVVRSVNALSGGTIIPLANHLDDLTPYISQFVNLSGITITFEVTGAALATGTVQASIGAAVLEITQ